MSKLKTYFKTFWAFDLFIDIKGVKIPLVKSILVVFALGAILF